MKRLLMIDCQVFQTPAWHRGMGKYSLELLRSLLSDRSFTADRKVVLVFSKHLALKAEVIEGVKSVAPEAEISRLDLKIRGDTSFLPALLDRNKQYIDDLIDEKYSAYDVEFLILSLFLVEGATSFPTKAKKLILMYDLIMLQFFEMYLGFGPSSQHFGHYKTLFDADLYLTISETVANDLVTMLGIHKKRIVSINGGPIPRAVSEDSVPEQQAGKPFILMPTGGDFRKNNHRGVRGFEIFNQKHDNKYRLVLTSTFGDSMVHELNNLSDSLVFTGNLSEAELAWYYANAEGILFPSEYEGLGLPILEAVDFDKPIACSDISVFREISSEAFYYFDPYSIVQIADALDDMVVRADWESKHRHYPEILRKYTWQQSTKIMIKAIDETQAEHHPQKARMAIVSPNIKIDNSLSRFVALQFEDLYRSHKIDFYYDLGIKPRQLRPDHLAFAANGYQLSIFGAERYAEYDTVQYHLVDAEGSIHTLMKALALPGEVVLHSPGYAKLYDLACQRGYISEDRMGAEAFLAKQYRDDTWLASVLRAAKSIKLFDETLHRKVVKLAGAMNLNVPIELMKFPAHELPYSVGKTEQEAVRVGLVITKNLDAAKEAMAAAHEKWGDTVMFKVFLDGVKEDAYYERLGLDYPEFIPQIGSSDFRLEAFMQQIDVLYSFENPGETTTKFMENNATTHGIKVVHLA